MRTIQIAISSDLCIRLIWNLTGSCVQQQRLRRWSRMVVKQFQDGGRPPFWKSLYRHISVKNRPILMKFCTQQQFLDERHVIKNEKVALDRLWDPQNVFLVNFILLQYCLTRVILVFIYCNYFSIIFILYLQSFSFNLRVFYRLILSQTASSSPNVTVLDPSSPLRRCASKKFTDCRSSSAVDATVNPRTVFLARFAVHITSLNHEFSGLAAAGAAQNIRLQDTTTSPSIHANNTPQNWSVNLRKLASDNRTSYKLEHTIYFIMNTIMSQRSAYV